MKQSKLRKRRVWRFAVLYFLLLVVTLALIVGPIVAGKNLLTDSLTGKIPMNLYQPNNLNNNDTRGTNKTGTGAVSGGAAATSAGSTAARVRLF
jgi:1,3-beta-glucan synthase